MNYSVSTTVEQEAALDAALVKHNVDLETPLTKEEFVQLELDRAWADRVNQLTTSKLTDITTAYNEGDAAKKAEFENLTK